MINDYSRAYKDIYYIIMAIEEEYRKKIPSDLIEFFKENADMQYISNINFSKPLVEQKISQKTEELLCLINLNYWCMPEEKDKLLKKYAINEKEVEEQLRNKYQIEFKKNPKIEEIKALATIEKENVLTRIIRFIKRIIRNKK